MKMTYEEFKTWSKENLKFFLPDKYDDATVEFNRMTKPGLSYDAITVRTHESGAVPAINIEEMFRRYENGESLYDIGQMMGTIAQTDTPRINPDIFRDYDSIKDKLFIRVSNADTNKELLSRCPHQQIGDLSITYSIRLNESDESLMSTTINNDLLESMGVDKETLHRDAVDNSVRIMPPEVKSITEMMGLEGENLKSSGVYVVTNSIHVDGASAVFYPGLMDEMAEKMGGSYYICPSSIHETILVPDHMADRSALEKTIAHVNETSVRPEDRLSYNAYHYDSKEKVFETASEYEKRVEGFSGNDREYKINFMDDPQHDKTELNLEMHELKLRM